MVELRLENGRAATAVAGDTYNTSAWLASLGARTTHVQDMGRDIFLALLRSDFAARRVERVGRTIDGKQNGLYFQVTDPSLFQRRFQYYRAGSAAGGTFSVETAGSIRRGMEGADCVYLTGVTVATCAQPSLLRSTLSDVETPIALGLNLRNGLYRTGDDGTLRPVRIEQLSEELARIAPLASVVLGSHEDFGLLDSDSTPDETAQELSKATGVPVVMTRGRDGADAWLDGTHVHCSASEPTRLVDSVGAGDAFAAGFLAAYLSSAPIATALSEGCALAGRSLEHRGALPHREATTG